MTTHWRPKQPDPRGPEPFSPGQRPRTHSLLGKGPVTPRAPEKGALSPNSRGPPDLSWTPGPLTEPRTSHGAPDPPTASRTPLGGPDPHILSGSLSGEGINSPPQAGPEPPRVHRYGHARGREASLEDSPTYRIQCGRRKCAMPQQSPRRLLPGCTVDCALPRRTVQPLTPPMPRASVCYAS